jgi:hypothetical protein
MSDMSEADEVVALVAAVRPLLVGKAKEVQGAALADLVSIWLAGHVVRGDQKATDRWRKDILAMHVETVRLLIPINYQALVEPQLRPDA